MIRKPKGQNDPLESTARRLAERYGEMPGLFIAALTATAAAESCSAAGAGGTPSMLCTSPSGFPPLPADFPPLPAGFPPLPTAFPPDALPPRQGESGRGVGEQADA